MTNRLFFVSLLSVASSVLLCHSAAVAQRSNGLSAEVLNTYGLSVQEVIGKLDFTPLIEASGSEIKELKAGPRLLDDAQRTFRSGNQPLARELFFAHAVAEYDQAEDALKSLRFSQHFRRPVWQIRWAVSLAVHGGNREDANPIPTAGAATTRISGSTEDNPSAVLESALGLVATTIADEFLRHASSGEFGEMIGILNAEEPAEPTSQTRVATQVRGTAETEPVAVDAAEAILQRAPTAPPIWLPGIVYLGEGMSTEMIVQARDVGLDLLLHFDVTIKKSRSDKVDSDARCRVFQVSDGKMLAVSKGVNRQEAEGFSRDGHGTTGDYVKEHLSQVILFVDQKCGVAEMPPLTPEIVRRRVGMLFSSTPLPGAKRASLQSLAEIQAYQSLGWLQPSEVNAAMDYIGGDEALFLIHGPLDEKLQRARQWAVDAQPTRSSN